MEKNPLFKAGKKTKEELLKEFLNQFETTKDGKVTKEEFYDYFKSTFATIPSDK